MFKKLDKLLERYDKLNQLVGDADVISRIDEWKAYTKELADISETVEKYSEYKKVLNEQSELKELLPTETDPELKELYETEIQACKEKIDVLTQELRILLIPSQYSLNVVFNKVISGSTDKAENTCSIEITSSGI